MSPSRPYRRPIRATGPLPVRPQSALVPRDFIVRPTPREVIELVRRTGGAVARGRDAVVAVRDAIHQLMKAANLWLEIDPRSDARWVDYIVVGMIGAAEGAAVGYAVGLTLGAMFAAPLLPIVGLIGGGVLGGMQGFGAVRQGWRIRVGYDTSGVPVAWSRRSRRRKT